MCGHALPSHFRGDRDNKKVWNTPFEQGPFQTLGFYSSLAKPEARRARRGRTLIVVLMEFLNVDSLHHFLAVYHRRLVELLTCAQFLHNASSLILSFEFLQGSFDVLAFFNLNDNHFVVCFLIFIYNSICLVSFFFLGNHPAHAMPRFFRHGLCGSDQQCGARLPWQGIFVTE